MPEKRKNRSASAVSSSDLVYGGFWIRVVADLIDSTVMNVCALLFSLLLFGCAYSAILLIGPETERGAFFSKVFSPTFYQVVFFGFRVVLSFFYYSWVHFAYQTSLGKHVVGLKLVSSLTLKPLSLTQSGLRTLCYALSTLPFGAGFLYAGVHPRKQALHDLLADTFVIRRV